MTPAVPAAASGSAGQWRRSASGAPSIRELADNAARADGVAPISGHVLEALALGSATWLPARSLPVRVTAAMRGSAMRPGTAAEPTSTVANSPGGNPASRKTSSICSAQRGTLEACLRMPALPAMSAGAAKRNTCQNGKFHGITASTAPMGRKCTSPRAVPPTSVVRGASRAAACSA